MIMVGRPLLEVNVLLLGCYSQSNDNINHLSHILLNSIEFSPLLPFPNFDIEVVATDIDIELDIDIVYIFFLSSSSSPSSLLLSISVLLSSSSSSLLSSFMLFLPASVVLSFFFSTFSFSFSLPSLPSSLSPSY